MSDSSHSHGLRPGRIDLNADLAEGFPYDQALLAFVTSANVCCGAHAGSPEVIRRTLRDARSRHVVVGAHPGYPDREGFGRREQKLMKSQVVDLIGPQLVELIELARELNMDVAYVKPHGALYNQAQREPDVAAAVVMAARMFDLPLLGQPGSVVEAEARTNGVPYFAEGFPDRRYRADGSLVPRSEPDAVLHDPAAIEAQVLRLVREGRIATLCIHGDDPRALANAELVRLVLERHGVTVCAFVSEQV